MKVHAEININPFRYMLVETSSSGGGEWRHPVVFRVVCLPLDTEYRHARQPGIEILGSWHASDSRSKGPRSGYGQALRKMLNEMPELVARRSGIKDAQERLTAVASNGERRRA